ncbi:MAG: pilus assembly protein TadG-related protein, partial [Planctomycetota bacterium]
MHTLSNLLKRAVFQITARPVLDMHNDQRGNVTFMMLALVMLFGGMVSALVNTATVVDEKMQLQTAADTAAYASAVHLSREINMVTSANISIALLKSAQAVTMANNLAFAQAAINYAAHIKAISDIIKIANGLAAIPIVGPALAAPFYIQAAVYGIQLAIEVVAVMVWYFATLKGIQGILETVGIFAGNGDLGGRITELYEYQQEVIDETPRLIEEQRGYLAEYYQCEIRITQPGEDNITTSMNSPLERGNGLDFAIPLSLAYYGSPVPMVLTGSIKDEDYGTMQEQWHGSGSGVNHFLTNRKGAVTYPALSKREVFTNTKTVLPSYAGAAAGMLIRREYHSLKSNNP